MSEELYELLGLGVVIATISVYTGILCYLASREDKSESRRDNKFNESNLKRLVE